MPDEARCRLRALTSYFDTTIADLWKPVIEKC